MSSAIENIDADSVSSVGTRFLEDSHDTPNSCDVQFQGNPFTMNSFVNLLCSPMSFLSCDLSGYPIPELTSGDKEHQSYKRKQQDQVFSSANLMQQAVERNAIFLPAVFSHEYDCLPHMVKKPRLANKHGDPLSEHIMHQLLKKGDHVQSFSHQLQELMVQHRLQYQPKNIIRSTQQLPIVASQQHQQNQRQYLCQELEPQFSCHERMMQYQYHIRLRPREHNIAYWREFVSQYYVPGARKRWCLSSYEKIGEHSLSIFSRTSREARHCDICGSNSGKGFEANFEVLPRLLKTKFENGVIDELMYLDFPREFGLPSGLMVLTYGKVVLESVYEQFRVVREGKLQIVFKHDFKILSWDFCAWHHEEFVARSSIAPKVNQLVQTAEKYTGIAAATVDRSSRKSPHDLLSDCNRFVAAGQRLTRSLEFLLVNDLGFSKSFVRCLQTAEVVNSMKDLMHFSCYNNIGAIESLQRYCQRRDSTSKHPTKKSYNDAAQVPPSSANIRNKPKQRHISTIQSSRGSSRMSSPFHSPHPQSSKVQGSPLNGFLISQLSGLDQKPAKVEVKEEVDTNEATDPSSASRKGHRLLPASSYPPPFFNAMEVDNLLFEVEDGILENGNGKLD